ncbi:hypothetical protein GGR56DRAFT_491399 [Xylariaceae sp. FL0804]|nr:hypothetical protein GGR56DRAFT_491399 [Xylariaceae sp. FL0804]
MRSTTHTALGLLALGAIIGALPVAFAHGDDEGGAMDMGTAGDMGADQPPPDEMSFPPSYSTHPEHVGAIYAHIILMAIGWMVVLPTAVMLSLARSRYTLVSQFLFALTNALGLFTGLSYNANTPDLYPNNAHHKVGWLATWVVSAQIIVSLIGRVTGVRRTWGQGHQLPRSEEQRAFIPVSTENMREHGRLNDSMYATAGGHYDRHSNDSGQGTEPNTESLRSPTLTESQQTPPMDFGDRRVHYEHDDDDDYMEELEFKTAELLPSKGANNSLIARLAGMISTRAWRFIMFSYDFVDRTILILGFIVLCTGVITYARLFEGHEVFSGLAHWIKGGVFFWMGLLTLGRWSGCFGELGWAWNVRPRQDHQKWRPTAEFVEGALIFFYGTTNIFLEHLGKGEDESFSAEDLEHLSVTVLFIGGGLLAMLIESTRIRELLNVTTTDAISGEDEEESAPPRTYDFAINPVPALVILLLGIMMSSHTQQSMISSMVHKQWGNLLTGASFARGLTYALVWLRPPQSALPSRPPTELLAAFGLIAGGLIFMVSSGDTVHLLERYDADAMFVYTVTMGMVGLLMSWEVLLLALKGWAVRREKRAAAGGHRRSFRGASVV